MNIIINNLTNIVVFGTKDPLSAHDGAFFCDIWRLQYSPDDNAIMIGVTPPEHFVANCMTYVDGVWTVVDQSVYNEGVQELANIDSVPMRDKRDKKLQDSDWTQVGDMPPSFSQPWAVYRQQLRDMTSDPGWPWIPFPPEPAQKSPTPTSTDLPTV